MPAARAAFANALSGAGIGSLWRIASSSQQRLLKFGGFVGEAPRHRHGVVENKPAHGRPSSINSLIVRPPSVTPLRNSRMRAPAACARSLSKASRFALAGRRTASSKQARGIRLDRAPAGGGLAGELGLNLGSDVNGDRHVGPSSQAMPLPCPASPPGVDWIVQHNVLYVRLFARTPPAFPSPLFASAAPPLDTRGLADTKKRYLRRPPLW